MLTNRWAILVLVMGAQTIANVGPLGIPAIAPLIRDSLGLSVAQAGSFVSAYYIGPVLMSLPAGWVADRWGVHGTTVAGQALIALGLVAASAASSFAALLPIMVLAGAGYGMLNPTTAKAVMAWFPRRQRATAIGLEQMGLPAGGAVGALALATWGLTATRRSSGTPRRRPPRRRASGACSATATSGSSRSRRWRTPACTPCSWRGAHRPRHRARLLVPWRSASGSSPSAGTACTSR